MADPTCVIQPFSYTTTPTPETHEEINPTMYGLGDSISFGSYVYEDLEWEKWSSFNNNNRNRHVVEAEKYSKPGSVAQKKAYFEAHFKRMAALKAAALLELSRNNVTDHDHAQDLNSSSNLQVGEKDLLQAENSNTGESVVEQIELYTTEANYNEDEINDHKSKDVNPSPPPPPPPPDHKTAQKSEVTVIKKEENHDVNNEKLSEIVNQMETPLLQEKSAEVPAVKKKRTPLSSYISSPSSSYIHPGKENYVTPVKTSKSSITSDPPKRKSPFRMWSINREFNRILPPVIKKLGSSSKASTPSKRGVAASLSTEKNKVNSPIIPNSFCLRNGERTTRRKQIKVEAQLNKFRQAFCFKAMSSQENFGDNGTFNNPKHKNESTDCKSPTGGRQSNRTTSQNTSLPPAKTLVKQNGAE